MPPIISVQRPDLLPLLQPSDPVKQPRIKEPRSRILFTAASPSHPSLEQDWIASTHFYPAAWPRSHSRSARSNTYQPGLPPPHATALPVDPAAAKQEQKRRRDLDLQAWVGSFGTGKNDSIQRTAEIAQASDKNKHAQRIAQATKSKEEQLWMSVQRIVPIDKEPLYDSLKPKSNPVQNEQEIGITLVVSHANGFHKEISEPALDALIQNLTSSTQASEKVKIDEIWNFDSVHSGHAASVNRDTLGDTISWFDQARDVLQFVKRYLPKTPNHPSSVEWLPTFLNTNQQVNNPTRKRKIVLLGHSFGGSVLSILISSEPDLADGLIMIDPALIRLPPTLDLANATDYDAFPLEDVPVARGAVIRKDVFESLPDAREYFMSKPYFQAWDPKVLDLHLRFGLRPLLSNVSEALVADDLSDHDLERTPLVLTNSKWHEASAFANTWIGSYGWYGLEEQRYSAWVGLISMIDGFDNAELRDTVNKLERGLGWRSKGRHLVTQQDPQACGAYTAKMLMVQANPESLKQEKLGSQIQQARL